jgi:hypothetical protein
VTARALRFESLTKSEREREVAQGYSDDLVMKQPAVMDLNMDGGVVLVCDRSATVGTIHDAPVALLSAIAESGGFALGTVRELLVGGRAANLVIS